MQKFIIRNDDVSADTTIDEIKTFSEICDKYGYQIIQAITPIGECQKLEKSRKMTNDQIRAVSSKNFSENKEVIDYLKTRNDFIAVHGLWHTHSPTFDEINAAKLKLENLGFKLTYFVPPFNEGNYPEEIAGLKLCKLNFKKRELLEDFLEKGKPNSEIVYLHSWRFDNKWYKFSDLEKCLQRLSAESIKLNLGCKYRKLKGFDNLDKIFGWKFQYGLPQYANESVDGITISHALMFLTNEELNSFTKEMYRVLKKDGVLRITEDDTENTKSEWFKTGNIKSGPNCLTGPKMMREVLEKNGFKVFDVDRKKTCFYDNTLMQAYRGGQPNYFFIEGIK